MNYLPPSPFLSAVEPAEALAVAPSQACNRAAASVDYDALFDAMLPPEPPPVFTRSPSQAFMRALFELSR